MKVNTQKQIDAVVRREKIARQDSNTPELAQEHTIVFQNSRGFFSPAKIFFLGKMSLLALLVTAVIPLSAFEAHVVNVTATIERPPCEKFDVHSLGYWKNNDNLWILPQTLGGDEIATPEEAAIVFTIKPNNARNRLHAQLLALKFNIAASDGGEAYVPGEQITLETLAQEADGLLLQEPPPAISLLNEMTDRIKQVNLAVEVTLCIEPSADDAVLSSNSSGSEEEEETGLNGANVSSFALSLSSESSDTSATTSAAIDDASATSSSDGVESGATSTLNAFDLSVSAADEDPTKEEINSSSREGNTAVSTLDTLLAEEEPVAPVAVEVPPPPVAPPDDAGENSSITLSPVESE